ncbi:MAG: type I restriction endonuclease subunit R [Prevotellaceae bacterium]|nr:type I restriction endonuclease subunit R [Prevotellaceae bacterium]
MNRISFKEEHISKAPALELLQKLGYTYISPDEALAMRGGKTSNVLLEDVLRKQLRELNSIKADGYKIVRFSEQNIENGVTAMRNVPMEGGYLNGNEAVYNMLTLGNTFEESIDGNIKSMTMQYIDWKEPKNNVYHVTEEFVVTRTGTVNTYRPDIVLFVNGIPLVIIECKRPDVKGAEEQAISQHLRNQQDDGIRGLYVYSSLLLAIGNSFGSYATTGSAANFWGKWHEMFNSNEEELNYRKTLLEIVNKDNEEIRTPTPQDEYIYNLCRPKRLLELTYHFTLFDAGTKKLARYQQYFTVKKVVEHVSAIEANKRNGGVVWHTQGSGKSLTMVMLAQMIATEIKNPRIVLVTDRTDLDEQITKKFMKCGKDVRNATTGKQLVELLESGTDAIITTVINKFATAVKRIKHPLTDPNIFVLIDEAHRSQYKELAAQMERVLPNACKIAFTGTPLTKGDKTARTFGGIIKPVYTINQAVKDQAVRPLLYEGRIAPLSVTEGPIDNFFGYVCEDMSEEQTVDLKKKFSRTDILNQTEQRIYAIATDISNHYAKNWKGTGFKAMLVTPKKRVAILYKKYLDEIGKVTSEVLITAPDDREGEETAYGDTQENVKTFWKRMMDEHGTPKKYQNNLIDRFQNHEDPEIIIVVDKLLTGFDEPKVAVMYIDRHLCGHTLLQAVARANRVCEGKEYGYIIDYYGVLKELDEALGVYADYDEEGKSVFHDTLTPIDNKIADLPQKSSDLWDMFKTIPNKRDIEAYAQSLRQEDRRHEFYDRLSAFSSVLRLALSTKKFYETTEEKTIQRYKEDMRMFAELRTAVQLRYSDTINYKKYEARIEKLINRHVESDEVRIITKLVNIFDKDNFQKEIDKVVGTAAKADTIASRTSKYITENMDSDPTFYKKLSQLIKETIEAYEQGRLNDNEYLEKMQLYKENVLNHTDSEMPAELEHNNAAKAYYGITLENFKRLFPELPVKEMALATTKVFDNIIRNAVITDDTVIVDWQANFDIIGRIKICLEDELFDNVKSKYGVDFPFNDMDMIIDGCVDVAKIWIR